ncbi:hypothetical protein ACFE33_15850 (plasmid) [Falsihalocynthiibacter sp. SS001]|uniref:hypothetical protein n=1 Tax=Falsihalocynthiibacter sp. SS001 TaxID=3349698 RepID=UPI0036D27DCF
MSMSKYMRPRTIRREAQSLAGRFRGGKLAPVMAQVFQGSESGILKENITMELDPIAGRMVTPVTAEIVAVYVPVPAIDALKNPDDDLPGNTEAIRQKLLSSTALFGVEEEGEISKRLGVVPRSVSGTKYVNEAVRLAHIVAVNHLRKRKYVNAEQLDASSMDVTPAILGQTVLDRLNGVLDPEDRVNGAVNFEGKLPVSGVGVGASATASNGWIRDSDGSDGYEDVFNSDTSPIKLVEDPNNPGFPLVQADLGATGADITLQVISPT